MTTTEFLIPELAMTENNKFVLVISCDGIKKGILFAKKPIENFGHSFRLLV